MPKTAPGKPAPQAAFLQNPQSSLFLSAFAAVMREPSEEYQRVWLEGTTRALDALHNSGWLTGGIEQATAQMVGPMMGLNAQPDPILFGDDAKAASEWARKVERRFEAWARTPYACDLAARQNLGQMCAQATKGWFGTGEICALIKYRKRPGNTHGTKIQVLPSMRIPHAAQNPRATQGVILDSDGAPAAYCVETFDARQPAVRREVVVRSRDMTGRPVVIHIHDSPATVVRGLTPLMPVLQVLKQYDQLTNATLTAALIQAVFAATVESGSPTEDVMNSLRTEGEQAATAVTDQDDLGGFDALMQARLEWYQNTKIDLGQFGKIAHLFPGEKLNFLRSEHPNSNFKPFTRFLLLEVARCLGITYEQLTGDREGATYSSERMGGAENWLLTTARRAVIPVPFMQAAYEAWLEEDIELGMTEIPGGLPAFYANRDAVCRAEWRGPPKPTADDLKTAKANEIKLKNRIITREMWSAEEGVDWENVDDQLLREQDNGPAIGLKPPVPEGPARGGPPPGGEPDERDEPEEP